MNDTAPGVGSIVQAILDHTIKRRGSVGLNYAAYAVDVYPDKAESEPIMQIVNRSANHKYLKKLLQRFGGPSNTPEEQIDLWEQVLPKLHSSFRGLDRDLLIAGQGENVRIVLDIDMGGFFYHRVSSHSMLFGVTLEQMLINSGQCDREMRQIVSEIQAVFTVHD